MLTQYDTQIDKISQLLKSISNEHRLKILLKLADQQMSVSLLNKHIDISQSALSQHLKLLRLANIITANRRGTKVYYSINGEDVFTLLAAIRKIYLAEEIDQNHLVNLVALNDEKK